MNADLTTTDGTLGWGGLRTELSQGVDNVASSTKNFLGLEDVESNWKKVVIVLLVLFILYFFFVETRYSDEEEKKNKFQWSW